MDVKGKRIVLTGAAGGIGAACATRLAAGGARLLLVSRNARRLEGLSAGLPGEGHLAVAADLTSEAGRLAVVDACGGDIDVLINNAGINHFGLLETQSEAQLREMFEINALAPILLTRMLLPDLRQRPSAVVNVGSGFGSIGFAGYCGYSASKFALRGFTEALRREVADTRVEVLYLAPRATATDMNPQSVVALNLELGNAMDPPERVASELMTLLRKTGSARYIGWPERFFVKLNAIFPSLVDRALASQLPVIRKQALAASAGER
jgi:short-subunit dehydrogenase